MQKCTPCTTASNRRRYDEGNHPLPGNWQGVFLWVWGQVIPRHWLAMTLAWPASQPSFARNCRGVTPVPGPCRAGLGRGWWVPMLRWADPTAPGRALTQARNSPGDGAPEQTVVGLDADGVGAACPKAPGEAAVIARKPAARKAKGTRNMRNSQVNRAGPAKALRANAMPHSNLLESLETHARSGVVGQQNLPTPSD